MVGMSVGVVGERERGMVGFFLGEEGWGLGGVWRGREEDAGDGDGDGGRAAGGVLFGLWLG